MTAMSVPDPVLHQRLVVGFDGSESSLSAMEWAASEAEVRGASVHVVSSYYVQPIADFGYGASGTAVDMTESADFCLDRVQTVDYTETDPNIALDGQIGPQVHSGGVALVQVKDVTIEELPPTPGAPRRWPRRC